MRAAAFEGKDGGPMTSPKSQDFTDAIVRPPRPPLAVSIRCLNCPSQPAELSLREGTVTVGAGSQADLVIDSKTVSRAHLEVSLVEEGVRIRDLGSRNGTFYLGQRVDSATVQPGTRLLLGSAELAIEPDFDASFDGAQVEAGYSGLVGSSPAMQHLFAMLRRLEGSLVSVLITGPSGVGKELVARALHDGSLLRSGPYIVKNCAAMSKELVLSELFGHRRGAFTGALEARVGAFEAAHGGTLFLDEVGELPLDVQPMLLRALESGEVCPVGSNEPKSVRVRVIAATNRDLEEQVREGTFREDLYFRLAVVTLRVPALRERMEDIEPLATHLAQRAGMSSLPPDVLARFRQHAWPGNVRELRNAVQAYAALGNLLELRQPTADPITSAFASYIDLSRPFQEQKENIGDAFTRAYLVRLLAQTGGNQSEAARISGIERSYLRKLMTKHGVIQ